MSATPNIHQSVSTQKEPSSLQCSGTNSFVTFSKQNASKCHISESINRRSLKHTAHSNKLSQRGKLFILCNF